MTGRNGRPGAWGGTALGWGRGSGSLRASARCAAAAPGADPPHRASDNKDAAGGAAQNGGF